MNEYKGSLFFLLFRLMKIAWLLKVELSHCPGYTFHLLVF